MEIPFNFRMILHFMRGIGYPEAVIAGGAMRDLYHGVPHKDVDVFVSARRDNGGMVKVAHRLEAFLGRPAARCVEIADYLEWSPEVTGFVNYRLHGEDVQIVGIDTRVVAKQRFTDYVMNRIDFGICQIAYDGDVIAQTGAFSRDAAQKTFTVVRCDGSGDYDRTMRRWGRLHVKYPDHRLVVPPDNDWSAGGRASERYEYDVIR